jgi:predicted esterase
VRLPLDNNLQFGAPFTTQYFSYNMATTEVQRLPQVLCLHGAGSSGAIFKAQGRRIFHPLRDLLSFNFASAPFASKPGPGMRPAYEDSGPFWRWHCDMMAIDAFDITETEVLQERDNVRQLILNILKDNERPVVGIMAFSQGARVATGLLLYLERLGHQGKLANAGLPRLQFAVLSSATYPPLYLDQETEDWVRAGGLELIRSQNHKVSLPTLHLHGSVDPWRPESEKMKAEFFAETTSSVVVFTGGHQLPVRADDASKVVSFMEKMAVHEI